MKKNILGIALFTLSLVSFSAAAQNSTQQSCPQNTECRKGGKTCDAAKGKKECKDPFAGITLTDAQKAKLDQLKAERKAACDKARQTAKEDKAAKKEQKATDRKEGRRKYLQDVKQILTPEQYVVWLENIVVENDGHKQGAREMRGPKGAGKDLKGYKMGKGDGTKADKGGRKDAARTK